MGAPLPVFSIDTKVLKRAPILCVSTKLSTATLRGPRATSVHADPHTHGHCPNTQVRGCSQLASKTRVLVRDAGSLFNQDISSTTEFIQETNGSGQPS